MPTDQCPPACAIVHEAPSSVSTLRAKMPVVFKLQPPLLAAACPGPPAHRVRLDGEVLAASRGNYALRPIRVKPSDDPPLSLRPAQPAGSVNSTVCRGGSCHPGLA